MKTLHYAMMTVMLTAGLAVAVGAMHPSNLTAEAQQGEAQGGQVQHGLARPGAAHQPQQGEAQHDAAQQGQADDPQAHLDAVAEHLELTDAQREKLQKPFHEAFALMQEMHRLHDVIAAELTDGQMAKLAQMIHGAMGSALADPQHEQGGHGDSQH